MSIPIPFHKLNNTRDLGGMQTTDGRRIRSGKLFRSGQLYEADEYDRQKLEEMLDLVVDFRTETERSGVVRSRIQFSSGSGFIYAGCDT